MQKYAVRKFPANWTDHGKRAGPLRNELMAQACSHVIVFWDGKSPGTGSMIKFAEQYNKPCKIVRYESGLQREVERNMALMKVSGQIYKIFEKEWSDKVLKSIKLESNPIYYRWGDKPLPNGVVAGANVAFDAEPKDDKAATIKGGIAVTAAADVPKAEQSAAKVAGSTGGTDWAAKDASIRYQSSRKDALAFVALPGVIDGLVGKAKPADKLGIIEATVDRYTAAFYDDVGTFGAVTRANAVAEPTPGADDSDEE